MIHSPPLHRSFPLVCRLVAGLLLAACLAPAAHGEGWSVWPFKKEEKPGKPDKVVAIWTDTVLTQAGRPPIRGFGGRLMFYEGKNEDPIKVEGTLTVYAFDETDRDANNNRPDRKYAFMPQQLPQHYSKSKVGHSYSVWLPWDEVGGMQKEITLIVRFEPKEGSVTISEPCRELLPGRVAPTQNTAAPVAGNPPAAMLGAFSSQASAGVQPAAYQAPAADAAGSPQGTWQQHRISSTTIDVPSGSVIRASLNLPQTSPAAGGYYSPGPVPAGTAPRVNFPPQNYAPPAYAPPAYAPQGYAPPAQPAAGQQGLQLRAGFSSTRQWPLGEPMARLNRDRAPSPPRMESPYGGAPQVGQQPANVPPAAPFDNRGPAAQQ